MTASINDKVVDPSHPLAKRHPSLFANKLPIFRDPALTVRVFPKALLEVTSWPRPDPPFSMAPERRETKGGQLNMSLMHIITRKVHKSSVIRSKIKNRLKNAVSLIATHGSRVETKDGRKLIVSDMSVAGSKIVLTGELLYYRYSLSLTIYTDWTYLFMPQLEIYRMPDTDLIDLVRQALEKVHSDASALNETWSNMDRMAKNNVIRSPVERRPPVQKDRFQTIRPQLRPEEQRTSAVSESAPCLFYLYRISFHRNIGAPSHPLVNSCSEIDLC